MAKEVDEDIWLKARKMMMEKKKKEQGMECAILDPTHEERKMRT